MLVQDKIDKDKLDQDKLDLNKFDPRASIKINFFKRL
jgi:ribosomal protein L33